MSRLYTDSDWDVQDATSSGSVLYERESIQAVGSVSLPTACCFMGAVRAVFGRNAAERIARRVANGRNFVAGAEERESRQKSDEKLESPGHFLV
jgi:hypothetical protein